MRDETDSEEPRRIVRLKPSIPASRWQRLLAVADLPADQRAAQWRALAASFGAERGAVAVALVLADLCSQGWGMTPTDGELWVQPPAATAESGERAEAVKERLRGWLRVGRTTQLADEAVRAFITKMETPRVHRGRRVSALDLVDDGQALAASLRTAAMLPPDERASALSAIVRPTLEVVEPGAACEITGHALIDVWRYFRHTWSLEYRPTPGRSLFFLIRNRARPNAPVMAIGALANATLQMRTREEWVAWSAVSMRSRVEADPTIWPTVRARLLATVRDEIKNVRTDDLIAEVGKAKGAEREQRLLTLANAAKRKRDREMQTRAERMARGDAVAPIRRLPTDDDGEVAWREAAESTLFRAKRAKALADLWFAERVLSRKDVALEALRMDAETVRAFAIACREVRKVGLASRLLELNVCGAVPPYGDLLAGKLAAVAVASREIIDAYARRYADKISEITSQMAGRAVIRSADACVITTTSLYGLAASQYNRLRLLVPVEGAQPREVRWSDLGQTEGYGTTQFGEETVEALRALSMERRGGRRVNNLFGEGQSPRMRQVREAFDDLGLDSDGLLRHSQPRRVYALELFPGARECLRMNERAGAAQPTFEAIADAWLTRWLVPRVAHRPALDRIAGINADFVRRDLAPPIAGAPTATRIPNAAQPPPPSPIRKALMPSTSNPTLIQTLYRASAACADHHEAATVRLLHIETSVDDFLRTRAKAGGAIFVTGNPGDGKTHLLRHLDAELRAEKIELRLDANEEDADKLIAAIDDATKRKGRGIAIAINEGILVGLLKRAGDRAWASGARDLLMRPYVYRAAPSDPVTGVAVIDLDLRNNLAPPIVRGALKRLLDLTSPCAGCPKKACRLQTNADRLNGAAVDRLVALLDAVARGGFHATMRDLQGFLAYLLSGADDCETFKAGGPGLSFWDAAFVGGQGPLFDAVRARDPSTHTVPLLDDLLWRGAENPSEWTGDPPDHSASAETLDERRDQFTTRKRRALFEHAAGEQILAEAGTPAERALREVMEPGAAAVRRVVSLLNRFFDRDEDNADLLHLWVTHRYDANPNRFAATRHSIATAELELLVPKLRPEIRAAFPDFHPPFAMLCHKRQQDPREGLRLDRQILVALVAAEQGLPAPFRRGEPEARVAAFFDRLTKLRADASEGLVDIKLVDMDTGANFKVGVDLARARYERLGGR
jgi:hypothetical protein